MKKIFVLDTNVLIHDPDSIFKFEENEVVIPLAAIEELDGLKRGHGGIGRSARQALQNIDTLRGQGDIVQGVRLESGGTVRIGCIPSIPELLTPDNRIIHTALSLLEQPKNSLADVSPDSLARGGVEVMEETESPVVLVSKDTAVRIRAESAGLHAEDYRFDKTSLFQQFGRVLGEADPDDPIQSVYYRQGGQELLRYQGGRPAVAVKEGKSIEGIAPKSLEQRCAIDALLNPQVEIVALTGYAGTGKTLLALAAGIHQVTKKNPLYGQVVVARPVVPMGHDLGYLPGDVDEKMSPWMQPIYDNLEVILHTPRETGKEPASRYKNYQYLIDTGILQIEALPYIRGRSLPERYFIIDEAQNLRPLDVKTIITRCGEGTKIVLTGDLNQIDTPYLDSLSNGLAYLISRFLQEENFCYLNLRGSFRSRLAEQGAQLL